MQNKQSRFEGFSQRTTERCFVKTLIKLLRPGPDSDIRLSTRKGESMSALGAGYDLEKKIRMLRSKISDRKKEEPFP